MCKLKSGLLAAMLAAGTLLLAGCGQVDESILDTNADFSVNISVPFPTTTALPQHLDVPEQVVIDANGKVTVNDQSLLISSFTKPKDERETSRYNTLSLGDTGFAVQTLQQRLKELGYFQSGVSGIFDAETETSVKRFEQTYGIMQTGVATPVFQTALFSSSAPIYNSDAYHTAVVSQYTTLQRGSVGSAVYALQYRLKELGYPIDDLTAIYDEQTENAVSLFYTAYGLEPQTVAYIAVQKELYSEGALQYSIDGEIQHAEEDVNALVPGNVGTLVMQIQNRLIQLGYMHSTASGIFDAETEAAVRLFEEACDFKVTGTLSHSLQAILLSEQAPAYGQTYSTETVTYIDLAEGSEGEDVLKLQERLIRLGYAAGSGNGVYGSTTAAALKMFQRYNNLDETGIATAYVQSRLFSPTAISYQDVLNGITVRTTPEPANNANALPLDVPFADAAQTLALNSTGAAVLRLQQRLTELGYDCPVNGTYDGATERAVREFQAAVGVTQSGEASSELQHYVTSKAAPQSGMRLYNSTQSFVSLQEGDSGEAVTRLQQRLWQLGYLLTESVQDSVGTYHNATRLAVASAQLAMGYTENDGIAGPEFQCFLFSDYGDYIKK